MSDKRKKLLASLPNYVKNVGKSVTFSARDIIKDIAPEVSEFTESSAKITQDVIRQSRSYGTNFSSYLKSFQNSQVMKDVKQIKKDALEDLKSGNFYNQSRADARMDESIAAEDKSMMADLGFDFSDADGDVDDEAILKKMMGEKSSSDSASQSGQVINNITVNKSSDSALSSIAKVARLSATTAYKSSEMVVENQNVLHSVNTITNQRMFAEVSTRLSEMSGYLKGLFDYTGTLNNYITSTMTYYDTATKSRETMIAMQQELNDITKIVNGYHEKDEESDDDKISHSDVFRGGINFGAYKKNVKNNAKEVLSATGANAILDMFNFGSGMADTAGGQSFLQVLGQNPLKFISNSLANKMLINPIKNNLVDFNNTFKSFFKASSLKGKRMAQDNPMIEMLYNIFGVKADKEKSVDLSSYEKGPIQFNGIVQQAIVEVIPTYLRQILKAIKGGPEYVYDYNEGQFKDAKDVKKTFEQGADDAKRSSFFSMRNEVSSRVNKIGYDPKDASRLMTKFDSLMDFLSENEHFFNPEKDKFSDLQNAGMSDLNEDEYNDIRKLILSTGRKKYLKINDSIYNSREDYNNYIDRTNKDIFKTGISSAFNGMKYTEREQSSILNSSILNIKDKYKHSLLDYVRDIKTILLEGIFTYNIKTKKGVKDTNTMSNYTTRLDEHRKRLKEAKAKVNAGESISGAETYGDGYVPTPKRAKIGSLKDMSPEAINAMGQQSHDSSPDPTVAELKEANASLLSTIKSFTSLPTMFINTTLESMNRGMLNFLYGDDGALKSLTGGIKESIANAMEKANLYLTDKILNPLNEKLFGKKPGKEGIFTKMEMWAKPRFEKLKSKIQDKLFGVTNDLGGREGGLLSGLMNRGKNLFFSARNYITGQGYTDAITGKVYNDREDSAISYIRKSFGDLKEQFAVKLFGKKQDDDTRDGTGIISQIKNKFISFGASIKDKYFGNVDGDDIKEKIPKLLAGAGMGAGASLFSTLFLPMGIGLVPGILLGGATAFVQSSEKAQNFLFGEKGLLGPDVKEKLDKYLPSTAKGLGIGGVLGVLTGNPLLGPMIGATIGFAKKSDTVQKFLFGTEDDDSEALIKKATREKIKSVLPTAGAIGAGTFLYSNLGFFGSALMPSGIIGASMFGFASAMALQSESVKKFLFGEKNEDGTRDKTGVLGKLQIWFKYSFIEEIKMRMYDIGNSTKLWFKEKIGNKLLDATRPMFEELKRGGKKILGFFGNAINNVFEKSVGVPLKGFIETKILNPLKGVFGKLFGGFKKIIEAPFAMLGRQGEKLAKKHEKLGLGYTSEYFAKKKERDSKIIKDKDKFKAEKSDRRQKLSVIQQVLAENGYNIKNSKVQDAIGDFDKFYKGGNWRKSQLQSFKSIENIKTETIKHTSLFDQLCSIGGVIKDDFKVLLSHVKDNYMPDLNGAKNNIKNGVKNSTDKVKQKVGNIKSNVMDFANTKTKGIKVSGTNIKINTADGSVNIPTESFKGFAKFNGVMAMLKPKTGKIGETKSDKASVKDIKTKNVKIKQKENSRFGTDDKYDVKDNSQKSKGIRADVANINVSLKRIDREISGQLDGVGWNLDAIRNILSIYTGIDAKGLPIKRRGNKGRSLLNRVKNALMRPVDVLTEALTSVKEKVVTGITGVFNGVKATIGTGISLIKTVLKTGLSVLETSVKTLGAVISEGAKVVGRGLVELTKFAGTLAVNATKAVGNAINGVVKGIGTATGKLVKGLGVATGKVVEGLGKLTGSLISAGGILIKGVTKITTDIAKSAYSVIKGAIKGITTIIKAPFKAMSKTAKTIKHKVTGGGDPVVVKNFTNLLDQSKTNPLHVIIVGKAKKLLEVDGPDSIPGLPKAEEKVGFIDKIKNKFNNIKTILGSGKESLINEINSQKEKAKTKVLGMKDKLDKFKDDKGNVYTDFKEAVFNKLNNISTSSEGLLTTVNTKIVERFKKVKEFGHKFKEGVKNLPDTISNKYNNFKTSMGNKYEALKNLPTNTRNGLINMKNMIKSGKNTIFQDIANARSTIQFDITNRKKKKSNGLESDPSVIKFMEAREKLKNTEKKYNINETEVNNDANKTMKTEKDNVISFVDKVSKNKNYDFLNKSEQIEQMETNKVVMAKSMAQTAEASKGTFAFLAKQNKKGGIFKTIGSFLLLTLPAIIKKVSGFFKDLKSGKGIINALKGVIKGTKVEKFARLVVNGLSTIGKGIMAIANKLGITKLLGKAKDAAVNVAGKAKDLGVAGINKIKDKFKNRKSSDKPSIKDKLKSKFNIRGINDLDLNDPDDAKLAEQLKNNKGVVRQLNPKLKKNKSNNLPESKNKSVVSVGDKKKANKTINAKSTKGTKGKKGILSKVTNVAKNVARTAVDNGISSVTSGVSPSDIDLSSIENAITINGNVLLQVNGNVIGGSGSSDGTLGSALGGSDSPTDAITDTITGLAADKAEDVISGKISKKLTKGGKKAGKKAAGKAVEGAEKAVGKSAKKGLLRKRGKAGLAALAVAGSTALLAGNSSEDTKDTIIDTATSMGTDVATDVIDNKVTGKVVDFAAKRAEKAAANTGVSAVTNVAGNVANGAAKSGILTKISSIVTDICNSKIMTTAFGSNANKLPEVAKWIIGKFSKLGAKKLPSLLAKLTASAGSAVASLGVVPLVTGAWNAGTGLMEVRRIFKLDPDADVTMGMRTAAALAKVVSNNLTFGFIDSSDIANFLYNLVAGPDDKKQLQNKQQQFKDQYDQYVQQQQAAGEEAKDFDSWNEDKNKSVAGKIWDGAKSVGGTVVKGVKAVGKGIYDLGSSAVSGIKSFFGFGDNKDKDSDRSKTSAVVGAGALAGGTLLTGAAFNNNNNSDQEPTPGLDGSPINMGTAHEALTRDARILTGDYLSKNKDLQSQIRSIEDIRKQSDKLIQKSSDSAQLSITKANDAMKNTTSLYGDFAANAVSGTMGMASMNSTASATAYQASSATGGPVVGTAPQQVQKESTGLWDSIKNTASSIVNGVKNFFGFGGNGEDNASAQPAVQPAQVSGAEYANGMVYFSQYDPKWASHPYNGPGESNRTIQTSGCGPTSAAMVVSSLTGKYIDPVTATEFAKKNNMKTGAGTTWNFFKEFGKKYGVDFTQSGVDKNKLQTALRARQPVILSGMGPKPFTRGGHYVVAAGITPDGNSVMINDPVNKERSITYPISGLLSSAQQMWIAGKGLTGTNPALTGVPTDGTAGAAAPEQPSSPMDILSKIGSVLTDATSSIMMGKVYEPNLQPQATAATSAFTGSSSSKYAGKMGTVPLPAGVLKWKSVFDSNGAKYGVEPEVMESISAQESGGDPNSYNGAALGLMQIENTLASEFASFGKKTTGKAFTLADRADPNKAIPFATSRFSDDLKHYSGDYLKTLQAYNFSKYSLDMLIKKYPKDWMDHRKEMGSINGVGGSYGDPHYIENVLKFYRGKVIQPMGGNGLGPDDLLGSIMTERKPTITTEVETPKPRKKKWYRGQELKGFGEEGGNGGEDATPTPKDNTSSVKVNKFINNSMRTVSDRIDNMLTAKSVKETTGGTTELGKIIALLSKIVDNTSEIADHTDELAQKEFTNVTNNVDNSIQKTDVNDNRTQATAVSSNPFVNAANQSSSSAVERGYAFAKKIASK